MKKLSKKVALILSILLLVFYVISLTFIYTKGFGLWGLLAIPFFIIAIIYQVVSHLLGGDIQELIFTTIWLGSALLLYLYSKNSEDN